MSHTAIQHRDGGLPKTPANVPYRPTVVAVERRIDGVGMFRNVGLDVDVVVVVIGAVVDPVWTVEAQNTVRDWDRVATIPRKMPKIVNTPGIDVPDVVAGLDGPRLLLLLWCQ